MAMKDSPHSSNLQHSWSLAIKLFNVISWTFVVESYPSAEMQSMCYTAPADFAGLAVKSRLKHWCTSDHRSEVAIRLFLNFQMGVSMKTYSNCKFTFLWLSLLDKTKRYSMETWEKIYEQTHVKKSFWYFVQQQVLYVFTPILCYW